MCQIVHFVFLVIGGSLLTVPMLSIIFGLLFLFETMAYGRSIAALTVKETKKPGILSVLPLVAGQILLSMGIAHAGLSQANSMVFASRNYIPQPQPWPWDTLAGGAWLFCFGAAGFFVLAAYLRTDWSKQKLAAFGLVHAMAFVFAMAAVTIAWHLGMPFSA